MRAEIGVAAPGQPDTLAVRVQMLKERFVAAGASAELLDTDTLDQRLREERLTTRLPWMSEMAVAAWTRVGG
jgi:hypothetical protein